MPVPGPVAEAADRGRLGAHVAAYGGRQDPSGLGCMTILAILLGVVALVLLVVGAVAGAVVLVVLAGLALLGRSWERAGSRRNGDLRLDLYQNGCVTCRDGGVNVVRYDTTSVWQNNVRHTGAFGHTDYKYTLIDVAGAKVVLRGRSDQTVVRGVLEGSDA
ncbi:MULTISPECIES: hypothetical protein [unclassified Streptomyces]|uniref:hypothetical protein n=1 Tax=unclassified Streptomyces TaxID=2593676 RepID=UPI00380EEB00